MRVRGLRCASHFTNISIIMCNTQSIELRHRTVFAAGIFSPVNRVLQKKALEQFLSTHLGAAMWDRGEKRGGWSSFLIAFETWQARLYINVDRFFSRILNAEIHFILPLPAAPVRPFPPLLSPATNGHFRTRFEYECRGATAGGPLGAERMRKVHADHALDERNGQG